MTPPTISAETHPADRRSNRPRARSPAGWRRARVVGTILNEPVIIRLVGAIQADLQDQWHSGERRYLRGWPATGQSAEVSRLRARLGVAILRTCGDDQL